MLNCRKPEINIGNYSNTLRHLVLRQDILRGNSILKNKKSEAVHFAL